MNFSLNLNKIALLRNARGDNYPKLEDFAFRAINLGIDGLTLHPRPDHRHATSSDVQSISSICKDNSVEFNLEGNPFSKPSNSYLGFIELVNISKPEQITLVPDADNQITSDHGWSPRDDANKLREKILNLKDQSDKSRISLFIDNLDNNLLNFKVLDFCLEVGADTVEIHTGPYAKGIKSSNKSVINNMLELATKAKSCGLKVNAGHDLCLDNLEYLRKMDIIDEVSIGHSIIVDALNYGFDDTIKRYIEIIKG